MKKFVRYLTVMALFAVIVGVMLLFAPKPFTRSLADLPQEAQVAIYCRNTDLPCVNMGNGYLVECNVADFTQTISYCNGIDGISVRFAATEKEFQDIIRRFRLEVTSRYCDGNLIALCGYSYKVLGAINMGGTSVNLQVAFDGQTLTLGSPIILDSY